MGGGHLAEGRRQRAMGKIANIAGIAKDCRFKVRSFYGRGMRLESQN